MNPLIIGLTGSFGSGCSYIATNVLGAFKYFALSDVLKEKFRADTEKDPDKVPRRELQNFGDLLRNREGANFLALQVIELIKEAYSRDSSTIFVVDSIRNPDEISALRDYSSNFYLFGVYADREIRWGRVKQKYSGKRDEFDQDDVNDTGSDNPLHGQRVGDSFYLADVVFENNLHYDVMGNTPFKAFAGKINQYIELVREPLRRQSPLRPDEALMAAAYAVSQRSSCTKRKVGAVITDNEGNIISSGFNEVPISEQPCTDTYKGCYRDFSLNQFFQEMKSTFSGIVSDEMKLKAMFKKTFKNLDQCRALHAEENAIVSLARNGRSVPLDQCTIYSTTYPCKMCANKIVRAGIGSVVYLEPYPDAEGKTILEHAGINPKPFQGVTYRAYFRLYGEKR